MIGVIFYKLGAFFARRLPPRLSESISQTILAMQYPFRRRSRRNVEANLHRVVPELSDPRRVKALTRRVFDNFTRSIYCFLRLPFLTRDELAGRCDYNGFDELTRELSGRGGFIIVGPHVGPWEVAGACLAALGVDLYTVALHHHSRLVTRFYEHRRELCGVRGLARGTSAASLQRALREGAAVALLVDRPYGSRSRPGRWFDATVEMPIGHAALAVRCNVPVVTSVCVFNGGDRFRFHYRGPYYPERDRGHDAAVEALHVQCLRDMEAFVREFPEQWFEFDRLEAETFEKGRSGGDS